jgi:hypothetical protein
VDGNASREAAFPGDPVEFEVTPDPGCSDEDVRWSGGGKPVAGVGRRFVTAFDTGGTFEVTARCGEATVGFPVTVCDVDAWLSRAASFFGPSVDLSKVRVTSSRLVFGSAGTAWTCNDVIRFKRPVRRADLPSEATLIHELGHVWEHQAGQAQLLRGAVEQIGARLGRDPYDFGGPAGVRSAASLADFGMEGQAQIVTELWKANHGYGTDRLGVPLASPGYVDDLRRLVEGAGIGTQAQARRTVAGAVDSALAWLVNHVVDLVG